MKTTPQTFLKFIAGAAVAAAVLFLVWYFSSIVVYILISAVLAVVGNPLVKRLAALHIKGWKVPRWLAALVTLIVIWVVLATLCSLFVPLVFNKIYQLSNLDFAAVVQSIEEPIAQAQGYLHEFFAVPESTFSLSEALASALKQIIDIESLNSVFSSIVNVVLSSVIAIFSITFITFFFLRDEGLFYAMVTAMFPERYHENITRALDSVTLLLARYFTGILSESLMLMVAVSLTMMAFGMKAADAAFIGLVMGVMNVVPYAGPPCDGRDERGALCRAADRRYRFRLRGYRNPDRGDDRGAYCFYNRRFAADPQGDRRFCGAADALFRACQGPSARNLPCNPHRRVDGRNPRHAAGNPFLYRTACLCQGVLLAVPAGA